MPSSLDISIWAGLAGLLSHSVWFIHGEHDFLSRQYAVLWPFIQAVTCFVLTNFFGFSFADAIATVTVASTAFLGALFTSIIAYRVYFHKLRSFPGPLSWKITKLTHATKNLDFAGYKHLDDLHKRYGDFVRTGPNEISIADPTACSQILGPGSKCAKALWYDMGKPLISVHQCRDRKLHDIRRKIWDQGFSARSLRGYEPRLSKYTNVLMDQLRSFGGGRVNASKWMNYYSFDVMGDLAFGEPFHMLETGESHFAIPLLQMGMESLNVAPAVPWLFYIIAALPVLSAPYHKFINWSGEQAKKRKEIEMSEPDIMTYLFKAPPMSSDEAVNDNWEAGDARLIIVAGSDTTASALTYCIAELIKYPSVLETLRKEVSPYVKDRNVDYQSLQSCEYLNAVIDETLRLYPPIPSGLIRTTPPEGLTVNKTYIPGDINVLLPLHSIQRSPKAHEQPDDFIPERWCTKPNLIKDKSAWAPFSLGTYGCVGRNLAYMEMRAVLSCLVTEFDLAFAEGEDGSALINKSKDHFTLTLADLWITCTPRKV